MLTNPQIASRSCQSCKIWQWDEKTKKRMEDKQGKPVKRFLPLPCLSGPKACPKVSPTAGKEMSEKNKLAYQYWLECKATNSFPDDRLVRRVAAICDQTHKIFESYQAVQIAVMR
jgi:hypothetical protein